MNGTQRLTNAMPAEAAPEIGLRERQKAATREAILVAALEALAENRFEKATHEMLAERVGCARRTVYRYFPDRQTLLDAMWDYIIREPEAVTFLLPTDEASLTQTLPQFFERMDANALGLTVAMTTPRGRELRAGGREPRAQAWRAAMAAKLAGLPEAERDLPLAVLQLLRSAFAWLEMRDQWRLQAPAMALAVRWATQVLLRDLERRAGRPLGEGPAGDPATGD